MEGLATSLATLFRLRKNTYQRLLSLAIAWRAWLLRPAIFLSAPHYVKQVDGRLLPAQIDRLLKSAQEEKRRSEERFQIIADNASVMLWVSNADGAVTLITAK